MKLNQVTVPSTDLRKSVDFYEKLEFQLIVDSLPDYARFICPDEETTFSIHKVNDLSNDEGIWLYFECDNLDDKVKELMEKGFDFESQPTDQPWLWREAFLRDPDNNKLIFYHAGKNRKSPPWRVK